MRITCWVVVMVVFVFIDMMHLHFFLFQALLQDNFHIKREQCTFVSSDVFPRDIFNPEFADSQPTYIV